MRRHERKILKNNAELVDVLFELMYEKLWVAPYDRRRGNSLLTDFERSARRLAVSLGDTNLAAASVARAEELMDAVRHLAASVVQMQEAGLFPDRHCIEAADALRRLADAIRSKCCGVIAE